MLNIKKKIIAIAVICAMAVSMAACSDKKDDPTDEIQTATLTSEEAEQLKKVDLQISEYVAPTDTQQDPVEQGDSSSAEGGNSSSSGVDQSSFDAEQIMSSTDLVIVPGGEESRDSSSTGDSNSSAGNNSTGGNGTGDNNSTGDNGTGDNGTGNNGTGGNSNSSGPVIQGTKKIQQAFWMNLAGDYVFDGEFITADFKIKETTADGTYPITIEWLDFSNIDAVAIKANGINGSVVVGGDTASNTFKNDGSFEVMADNVSGKPGDTVTVAFRFNKNPGICASVFRFGYDSDALEYVGGAEGTDFSNALDTQNN